MNIISNYQLKQSNYGVKVKNNGLLQTNPSFGMAKNVTKKAAEIAPKLVPASITAAAMLAIQNGISNVQNANTIYGPVEYIPAGKGEEKSCLYVSRLNGNRIDIFKDIPQATLESPVAEHIRQIGCSTINPSVGIVITQNESNPVIARKIVTTSNILQESR